LKSSSSTSIIPIGIPIIDQFIQGFPRDAIILIIGDPGSGFISFLHQLLVFRAKKGIGCIYASLDKSEDETYKDLNRFEWGDGLKWAFHDFSFRSKPNSQTLQWDKDALNVISHQFFRKINDWKDNTNITTFDTCVNSITMILIQSKLPTVLHFINEYSEKVKGTGGWHFLTMVRGVHGRDKENLLAHYADVVLELATHLNTQTQLYERVLGIRKLLGVDSRVFPIEFDKRGIRPVTTSKIQ
jgi:KaiC/GvpD/RAD55 family RecA-like ATPase